MTAYRFADGSPADPETVQFDPIDGRRKAPNPAAGGRFDEVFEVFDHTSDTSTYIGAPVTVPRRRTSYTLEELMATDFPEPKWAVPGLVAEGLTFVAGSRKVGKSWFALGLAVAVASGGKVLGNIAVDKGDVLYLALEDNPRRLKFRSDRLLRGDPVPGGLHIELEWPALADGGAGLLHEWLSHHTGCQLVLIDVFAWIRNAGQDGDRYLGDYGSAVTLKSIADAYAVPVVCNHHTRKASADDFLDTLSGTQGLAGAADGIVVLKRGRGQADAVLDVTGRDVEERQLALKFDPNVGSWVLLGDAAEWAISETRRKVLDVLRERGPLTPKQVGEITGTAHGNAKQTLRRMAEAGQATATGNGTYSAPPDKDVTGVTQTPLQAADQEKHPENTVTPPHLGSHPPVTGEDTAVTAVTGGTGELGYRRYTHIEGGDWSYDHPPAPCSVCGEVCKARAPDGRVVHLSCEVPP